jgi:murein peptide amidase A
VTIRRAGILLTATLTAVVPALAVPTTAAGTARLSNKVVQRRVIGHSVEGRLIWAVEKGNPDAGRTVVVVGQMHGDERAGVRTARYIIRHIPVSSGTDLWVVPTMNPDGLAHNTRQNAHGVDLNRNWPMNWVRGPRGTTYPGRRPASEPETRGMLRFLAKVQPRFLTSLHQPFGEVGKDKDKPLGFQRRLASNLHLPLRRIDIGGPTRISHQPGLQPGGRNNAPTLTGWYNAHYRGSAITVEYPAHPGVRYLTTVAGHGIIRASRAN